MNKEAYLLGYKRASLDREAFNKTAYLLSYNTLDKSAEEGSFWDKYSRIGQEAGKKYFWDKTKKAWGGVRDTFNKNYDPSVLWDKDTAKGIKQMGVGNFAKSIPGTAVTAAGDTAAKTMGAAASTAAAYPEAKAVGMYEGGKAFLKDHWMPLLFGGLALGGGAMAMFGGRKNGQDNQGVRTYAGPQDPFQRQGSWQTFDPRAFKG